MAVVLIEVLDRVRWKGDDGSCKLTHRSFLLSLRPWRYQVSPWVSLFVLNGSIRLLVRVWAASVDLYKLELVATRAVSDIQSVYVKHSLRPVILCILQEALSKFSCDKAI